MLFAMSKEVGEVVFWFCFLVFPMIFVICAAYKYLTDADFRKDWNEQERQKREARSKAAGIAGAIAKMVIKGKFGK
jgi:hypothetical protein